MQKAIRISCIKLGFEYTLLKKDEKREKIETQRKIIVISKQNNLLFGTMAT